MKRFSNMIAVLVLAMGASFAQGQNEQRVSERPIALRLQLIEIETQLEPLRVQSYQLDEALKPESLEQMVLSAGSTRPEELREAYARQIKLRRERVRAELIKLVAVRTQVESMLQTAEQAEATMTGPGPEPVQTIVHSQTIARTHDFEPELERMKIDLQTELNRIDYELDPENVRRAFGAVGAVRPEVLREERLQLLTLQRDSVITRIKLLQQIQARLEMQ